MEGQKPELWRTDVDIMAHINRMASPMDILDEGIHESLEQIKSRKQFLRNKQRTYSPFLIGSIEEVNTRISQLDQQLQNYAGLVCESQASDVDETLSTSTAHRELFHKLEKQKKQVCQFAGVYTFKSTLLPQLSQRARNITKISTAATGNRTTIVATEDSAKPKFVELSHQKKFEELFFSASSQSIFLDTFWYLFVLKFQPDTTSQQKLFDRVAHNYVGLLLTSSSCTDIKEIFFKVFPVLLSQAVYSTFCFCFSDSYQQFGEQFKDDLVGLVFAWMAGIRPLPRSWLRWKMSLLEPANLKHREEIRTRNSRRKEKSRLEPGTWESLNSRVRSGSGSLSQSTAKMSSMVSLKPVNGSQVVESHPLGPGCDYVRAVFDTSGRSPLVQHFLAKNALNPDSPHQPGWLQRVELENLPPVDAPSYRDVVSTTTRNMALNRRDFLQQLKDTARTHRDLQREHKKVIREHVHRQARLLTRDRQVSNLSHLIVMDQRRGQDSVSAGADAAIMAALMSGQ